MNTSAINPTTDPRWRTYLKAGAFSMPALTVWLFCAVFLLPKLQQIWQDVGFSNQTMRMVMGMSGLIQNYFVLIVATIIGSLVLLEWRNSQWPRHRKASLYIAAFLVNTAVLVFLVVMFTSALLVAPALHRAN